LAKAKPKVQWTFDEMNREADGRQRKDTSLNERQITDQTSAKKSP